MFALFLTKFCRERSLRKWRMHNSLLPADFIRYVICFHACRVKHSWTVCLWKQRRQRIKHAQQARVYLIDVGHWDRRAEHFAPPAKKSGSLDFLKQSELSNWCCITLCITVYMSCRRLSFNASLYLDGCFQYSLIYNPSKFSDNWVSGRYHFLPLKLNKWCPSLYTYGGHEAPETWTPFNCEPSSRLVP